MAGMSSSPRPWKARLLRWRNGSPATAETEAVNLRSMVQEGVTLSPGGGKKDTSNANGEPKVHEVHDGGAETDPSTHRIGFMDLPGEIRNNIYRFILICSSLQLVAWNSRKDISRGLLRSPIYRLNRQIRSEALSILCAEQQFAVLNNRALDLFIEIIGPSGRASLADLRIFVTIGGENFNYEDHSYKSLLQLNLRYLVVRLYFRTDPDFSKLRSQAMKWGRSVRDVFYRGGVGTNVYIDVCMREWELVHKFGFHDGTRLLEVARAFLGETDLPEAILCRIENGERLLDLLEEQQSDRGSTDDE